MCSSLLLVTQGNYWDVEQTNEDRKVFQPSYPVALWGTCMVKMETVMNSCKCQER